MTPGQVRRGRDDEAQGSGRDRHRRRPQYRRGDRPAVRRRGRQGCDRRPGQTARRAGRGRDQAKRGRGRTVRGRCLPGRRRRGAGQGRGRSLRPRRYSGQQCRDLRQQAHLRHHRGGMGPRAGGDPQEPVPHGQARGPADGGAGHRRADRQCRLDLGLHGAKPRGRLFRRQGRGGEPDPRHGHATGAAQDQGERHRAEQDRLAGRQGRVRFLAPGAEHGEAPGPAAGGRQGGAVPGERGFLVRLRRQSVCRRRGLGDGSVLSPTPSRSISARWSP